MTNSIFKFILKHPMAFDNHTFLNGSIFLENKSVKLNLAALDMSKRESPEFRAVVQKEKLKKLLFHAVNLPFWEKRIGNALEKNNPSLYLPITSKSDLREALLEERTDQKLSAKYGILTSTSGSTGEPLQFFIDKRLKIRQWALLSRVGKLKDFSSRFLVNIWPTFNPNPLFGGYLFTAKTFEELRGKRKEMYDVISRPNSIIHGFPSLLRILVELAEKDKISLRPFRIITSGEKLDSGLRAMFQKYFKCEVVNYYGSRELSVMAGQCEFGRFHENSEDIIFEVVSENGTPLAKGKTGKLVITGLNSYISPFIRYYHGDYGFFYADLCPCGNSLPSFNFEGREHEIIPIKLPNGNHILPYRLSGLFNKKHKKIRQYQIKHYAPYSFIAYIVPSAIYNKNDEVELLAEFKEIVGDCEIKIKYLKFIEPQRAKVLSYIKSFNE